jgi:hypothetical protein
MEKTAVIFGGRNDGYKEDERVIVCLESMVETFDEVWFYDWNSPSKDGPLLWRIYDKIPKTGKIRHFVFDEDTSKLLVNNDPDIGTFIGGFAQNSLIRRCKADWIVCSALDIIAPKKEYFHNFLSKANPNAFYSISRREADYDELTQFNYDWRKFRDKLDIESEPRMFPARVTPGDDYSIINCCGDFQLASKHVWHTLKGYEEQMRYACYADTNIQKKAVLNNFKLEAIYNLPLYHMSHKTNRVPQGGDINTLHNKENSRPVKFNDPWKWVEYFTESENDESWGLGNTEIEFEII